MTHEGVEVAVKVQRPALLPAVSRDLYILREFLDWWEKSFQSGAITPDIADSHPTLNTLNTLNTHKRVDPYCVYSFPRSDSFQELGAGIVAELDRATGTLPDTEPVTVGLSAAARGGHLR
eukprot:5821601-Pyramimonas_sp.AAC.1